MKINFYATVCSLYALASKANKLESTALDVEDMLAEKSALGQSSWANIEDGDKALKLAQSEVDYMDDYEFSQT